MIHLPLVLNDGKISQLPAGDNISGALPPDFGDKFAYQMAALASYDRIAGISYSDSGLRTQRVNQITYSSSAFPDSDIVKTVFWLDVGKMNQRIDKIEYVGSIFSPQSLRKNFVYTPNGIRFDLTQFNFELF